VIGTSTIGEVQAALEKFEVPGIAVLAATGSAEADVLITGTDAVGAPLTRSSLFNLASVTKLATALCVLRLADRSELQLDDPLAQVLPEARAAQPGVTVRSLLCHTSGLPLDIPNGDQLYGKAMTWDTLARECLNVELERPPGTRVVYGNVGFGLLALVVERVTRRRFFTVLTQEVLTPLGIEGYLGAEPPRPPVVIADVRSRHAGTDLEPYNSAYFRGLGLPWSGLVTTPEGALNLVRAFAGVPAGYLTEPTRREATENQTDDLPGGYGAQFDYRLAPWGLGVDLRGAKSPHWTPDNASPRTFGHAGASGCVVWHDPEVNVSWAILGARTADNAWLVRAGPRIGKAILNESAHRAA
jgi:beta-lactamase class C